ncbi:MAG: hypothetical protein KGH54_00500 [Candidatus Micrarchaeota archaeon]|nr:hypothetical protein [Candidatus Micrarchaeota archaeon]
MRLIIHKSPDGRLRSDFYDANGERAFAVAERTAHGVLVSEFNEHGEVLDQAYKKSNMALAELASFLKKAAGELQVEETKQYVPVKVNAMCDDCKTDSIKREIEVLDPETVTSIPVIPLFVCIKCGKKYYSVHPGYLRNLVQRNVELFDGDEEKFRQRDEAAFIKEIQEYMIRVFASKKLARMKIIK